MQGHMCLSPESCSMHAAGPHRALVARELYEELPHFIAVQHESQLCCCRVCLLHIRATLSCADLRPASLVQASDLISCLTLCRYGRHPDKQPAQVSAIEVWADALAVLHTCSTQAPCTSRLLTFIEPYDEIEQKTRETSGSSRPAGTSPPRGQDVAPGA